MGLTIDSFRAIANDTSVSDRKYVYFANGKEAEGSKTIAKFSKLCFNTAESRPREFKRPEGADREQGSALMRSQLLTLVRDRLGGTNSAAFKEIETKLFGKLKNGQFDPEVAAKPLRKRDIKAVLTKMDLELAKRTPGSADALALAKRLNAAGQFVIFEKSVDPAVKQMLAPKGGPIKSTEDLTSRVANSPVGEERNDDFTLKYIGGDLSKAIKKKANKQFGLDIDRTSRFVLPDGRSYACIKFPNGDNADAKILNTGNFKNLLAQQVTGKTDVKFDELSSGGDEKYLKLTLFAMTMSNQMTLISEANTGIEFNMFKNVRFDKQKDKEAIFYRVEKTWSGGLKFTGSQLSGLTNISVQSGKEDAGVKLDPDKCYLVQSVEYEYTLDQIEKIVDADWTQNMDLNLLKPAKQEAHMLLHIG